MMVKLHRERPIPAEQVRALYDHVGWWPERTLPQIERVLDGAPAAGAWDGDTLVGFMRIVSDGVFRAYVEDVVVHEAYRHQGIATALMNALLEEVRDVHLVSLFCKERLVPVYRSQGFEETRQVVMHRKP
ncbi:MAG TPA: GNAT family N-acetyltransferase [Symbiobacteriaceae bacterium]|jgi:GNAT superfamily N-acetyltransferase|nr:GNAT family N-acetyltransferase [Symbiobacteriaceae bacterium]